MPEAKSIAEALLRAIGDPTIAVRAEAFSSLAHIGPSAGIDPGPIKDAAENDPAIDVRRAAAGTLYAAWPQLIHSKDLLPMK
jgi:hypothetical protein